jgi:hypothetical protein
MVLRKFRRNIGDIGALFSSQHSEVLLVDKPIDLKHRGRNLDSRSAERLYQHLGCCKLPVTRGERDEAKERGGKGAGVKMWSK